MDMDCGSITLGRGCERTNYCANQVTTRNSCRFGVSAVADPVRSYPSTAFATMPLSAVDGTPIESYHRLMDLFAKWRSEG